MQGRDGRTSDRPGSDGPLRRSAVRTEIRSNSRSATCGSSVRDRPRACPCCCKKEPDAGECRRDQRNDLGRGSDDLVGHVPKQEFVEQRTLCNLSRSHHACTARSPRAVNPRQNRTTTVFFNTISPKQPFAFGPKFLKPASPAGYLLIWEWLERSFALQGFQGSPVSIV